MHNNQLCECNPDMEQCPNMGDLPVVFSVYDNPPPDLCKVNWVCKEHFDVLTKVGLAREATDEETNANLDLDEGDFVPFTLPTVNDRSAGT